MPRSTSGTPNRRQYTPSTASAAATRRSHHKASSIPPATAYPSIAAITGLPSRSRVGPIGPGPSSDTDTGRRSTPAIAFRSAPAQKYPPVPVSTATCAASSPSKASNAASNAAAVAASTALRRSGRLIVITRTGPSSATPTVPSSSVLTKRKLVGFRRRRCRRRAAGRRPARRGRACGRERSRTADRGRRRRRSRRAR